MSAFTWMEERAYEPAIGSGPIGLAASVVLAFTIASITLVAQEAPFLRGFVPWLVGWAGSTWATDKYNQKYPQSYYRYLLASHGKAAIVLFVLVTGLGQIAVFRPGARSALRAAALVALCELLLYVPRRRMSEEARAEAPGAAKEERNPLKSTFVPRVNALELRRLLAQHPDVAAIEGLSSLLAEFVEGEDVGQSSLRVIEDDSVEIGDVPEIALLLQMKSLNTVRRLNWFLQDLPRSVCMGGYFAFRYRPMDEYFDALRARKKGVSLWVAYGWHFLRHRALPKLPILEKIYFWKPLSGLDEWIYRHTKERRRVISRAEMWGRAYYWGFEVLREHKIGEDSWVVSRRFRDPERERRPSFFLVARLTKVGLGGKPLQLHKLRTMYPFSEFIQERIFKDHGLSSTGKFRNDFRLTDYGRFLRRYWVDEIPQVFDWLRGDIKLVGMRATSAHFLGLYPQDVYDLYVRTKPGLIPPIFDATTNGFEDIVRVEREYLEAYRRNPVATDVRYLVKTLSDIFIRGIRSK